MPVATGPVFDATDPNDPDRIYQLPQSMPTMAAAAVSPGVARGMLVVPTSPTSMSVTVTDGAGNVDGFPVRVYGGGEEVELSPSASQARVDLVGWRLDRSGRTLELEVVAGTPGQGMPSIPPRDEFELLAVVPVPGNAVDLDFDPAATDWRRWAKEPGGHAGELRAFFLSSAPEGWLAAAGQSVSRARYPDLSDALGGGGSNMSLPNYRDRALVGAGGDYSVGQGFGNDLRTIGITHLPSHDHTANSSDRLRLAGHTHGMNHTHAVGRRDAPSGDTSHGHPGHLNRVAGASGTSGSNTNQTTGGSSQDSTGSSGTLNVIGRTGSTGGGNPLDVRARSRAALICIRL